MWIFWVIPLGNGLWIGGEFGFPFVRDFIIPIMKHVLV